LRKHRLDKYIFLAFVVSLFFFSSCAHYKINEPLKDATRNSLYSFEHFSQPPDSDETFVILTFSGGGTRAAAFSFGVLEGLKETPCRERIRPFSMR